MFNNFALRHNALFSTKEDNGSRQGHTQTHTQTHIHTHKARMTNYYSARH